MKLATQSREVSSHGLMSVTKATIATSAKVFDFFANQTYSDKFKAIVRELVANAIDAQREARNPDPVHVYLPDSLDPYFRVKDTGIGMSHEFCTTNFMRYSDGSTKDGANDAIGGFGIGSKSPFSYTDQFTLRSVHNGTCSVYSVFKDEDGIPCIALLEQTQTDEINGVEFSVPVEPEDFDKFRDAAQNNLAYFLPEVRLHGTDIDEPHYIQRGQTWGVRSRSSSLHAPQVIMGGMAYPVASSQMSWDLQHDGRLSPLLGMPLDLFLPIGSCTVTLSRESLLYDDNTKASIAKALEDIVDEITADMPTMFDNQLSRWEAAKALHEYLGGDQHSARSRLVLKHVQYKGNDLTPYVKPSGKFDKMWMIDPRNMRRRRGFTSPNCPSPGWAETSFSVSPGEIAVVIVDDLLPKDSPIKRIKAYVDDELAEDDRVLVIRPWSTEQEDIDNALEAFGNPQDFILTSSMPEPVRVRGSTAGTGMKVRPRVRMFKLNSSYLEYHQSSVHPRSWRSPVEEIEYANQPNTGTLVVCENFELPVGFWGKIDSGLIDQREVYLVNKSDAAKLADTWEMIDQVFEARLKDELAKIPTASQWKAILYSDLRDMITFIQTNPALFDSVPKSKPIARLMDLIDTYSCDIPGGILRFVEEQLPPRVDPEDLQKRIERDHWKFMTLKLEANRQFVSPENGNLFKLLKELI